MDSKVPTDPFERLRSLPMGQVVEIEEPGGHRWRGTLVPSHELSGPRTIQLKLENGYNVGLRIHPGTVLHVGAAPADGGTPSGDPSNASGRPTHAASGGVTLLTTGGTIASRVDYRTGGVRPVRSEREILAFYPDLEAGGPVHIEPVLDHLSEEITSEDWQTLAERTAAAFAAGSRGVVIAHGTDTLGYTAAALSFLLTDLRGPVVLVGAQRSPDRPSSDGVSNLTAAVRLARESDLGEVVVVMHAGLSDDRFAIHRGNRVRKMHSTRRDAFRSRNGPPLGWIDASGIHLEQTYRARSEGPTQVSGRLDPRATIVWFFPGLDPERAAASVRDLRGVVLAGTGLGHVSSAHLPWIRDAVARGVVVVMTTQCLEGLADPYIYATGRALVQAGVLYARDLLPESAYAKLLWALGQRADPSGVAA
ncbi:MAG TPA: Glu-tRNA(Gln) amidotransferase subunit GatD, partial [Thermoplasmata archaeon]|nr:Glu-tRNA(Gln) amidotransferase subunit GatD [Thermoplasmata archaeon]